MRGAESSKWFMSYEIYFELEYHYLWSNCNGRSLGEKKNKFYMRGAESSKWFMSYEIYFELEYHYLWSDCNGWVQSAHNNNLVKI